MLHCGLFKLLDSKSHRKLIGKTKAPVESHVANKAPETDMQIVRGGVNCDFERLDLSESLTSYSVNQSWPSYLMGLVLGDSRSNESAWWPTPGF